MYENIQAKKDPKNILLQSLLIKDQTQNLALDRTYGQDGAFNQSKRNDTVKVFRSAHFTIYTFFPDKFLYNQKATLYV